MPKGRGRCAKAPVHAHTYGHADRGTRVWSRSHAVHIQAHTHVCVHTSTLSPGALGQQGVRPPWGCVPFPHLIQKLSARKPGREQNVKCVLRGAACPLSWRAAIWPVSKHRELRIICTFRTWVRGAWGKGKSFYFIFNFLSWACISCPQPLSPPGWGCPWGGDRGGVRVALTSQSRPGGPWTGRLLLKFECGHKTPVILLFS